MDFRGCRNLQNQTPKVYYCFCFCFNYLQLNSYSNRLLSWQKLEFNHLLFQQTPIYTSGFNIAWNYLVHQPQVKNYQTSKDFLTLALHPWGGILLTPAEISRI